MLETPFDLVSCSWPRPIEQTDGHWTSEPEWDAPRMPLRPQLRWESIQGEHCWMVDWREWFRSPLKYWQPDLGGEMRDFHIVFHLRMHGTGTLIFWEDDGSLILRNGRLIHTDRTSHPLKRGEIEVHIGDRLEIAQWQYYGGWMWGATLAPANDPDQASIDLLLPYLDAVHKRLAEPNGPPLKMYCSGDVPFRTAISLYSMILNGYSPNRVLVFGEHQWSEQSRELFRVLLPFVQIVPTDTVIERILSHGSPKLVELAREHWFVMKTCIALLYPPAEFCLMDDDVFILDRVDTALQAFQQCDLVFAPDADYSEGYLNTWGHGNGATRRLPTGSLNAGLYWLRNKRAAPDLALEMLRVSPTSGPSWFWEQGFIACQFAHDSVMQLPKQSYFYPYFDGLPGGILGYDYVRNPCSFTSIHYGGLAEKPSDTAALVLSPDILGRHL
jgi:hypothetical protein